MDLALRTLHWLSVSTYGGSLIAFAILLAMRHRLAPLTSENVVRTWRAWGVGLGLSMGTLIFTGLAMHYLSVGAFTWSTDDLSSQLRLAADLVFLALWLSSFQLEIWTMEPTRKLDKDGVITDPTAYEACVRRVSLQASVNAALFIVVGALSVAAVHAG